MIIHPKGTIAHGELHLMKTNVLLMLSIIVPTLIALFVVVWMGLSSKNSRLAFPQWILWIVPSIVVAILASITWKATHELDPYRPLESQKKPLHIQVIALDWKWLFIYPEQGIATLNFIQIPEERPIRFSLSADGSPMNSFWIPQLSGQIYAMSGMVTTLYIQANESGEYTGRAAEINGKGFADMTFIVKATSETDFDDWVESVKRTPNKLTAASYSELVKPSMKDPITLYSSVENGLFDQAMKKYLEPAK